MLPAFINQRYFPKSRSVWSLLPNLISILCITYTAHDWLLICIIAVFSFISLSCRMEWLCFCFSTCCTWYYLFCFSPSRMGCLRNRERKKDVMFSLALPVCLDQIFSDTLQLWINHSFSNTNWRLFTQFLHLSPPQILCWNEIYSIYYAMCRCKYILAYMNLGKTRQAPILLQAEEKCQVSHKWGSGDTGP